MKKLSLKNIWAKVGITGLIILALSANLIYMNLRSADPILDGWEEYEITRFSELMKRDEPVLVEVYASWCPTCLLQHEAFETLHEEGRAPAIRAIRVDYDRDIEFLKKHRLPGTGMLIIFRNGREISRASGLVTPDKIRTFVDQNNL